LISATKSFNGEHDMKTDNFYVYASDHLIGIGRAIAIITVVSEDGKKWLTEAFVFLPRFLEKVKRISVIWDIKDIPADIPPDFLTLDEAFMLQEGILKVDLLLFDALKSEVKNLGVNVNLKEAKYQDLMHLLRLKKREFVSDLMKETECTKLRNYLTLILGIDSLSLESDLGE